MNNVLKVIAVTTISFAAGYALYSMLNSKGVLVKKVKVNGSADAANIEASNPQQNADAIGDAIAGVLID